jgi:hypothetical protein
MDLEKSLIGKTHENQGELSQAISKHTDPNKATHFGQFHKTFYFSFESMQKLRLWSALFFNAPVFVTPVLLNGIDYFIMYAT